MDESSESSKTSPKPLAFTIDFNGTKNVDTQRQKLLAEKLQKRHKRGQSLSKLENCSTSQQQHPSSGNLPRKSSFQSEGYYSSDEKQDKSKSSKDTKKHREMTLFLKHSNDVMTRSFPGVNLPAITSPNEFELKDICTSNIELDIIPFRTKQSPDNTYDHGLSECYEKLQMRDNNDEEFIEGTEFDFEKSDTASDTGTYTLDAENYSEDQKARMSIDRDFNIEHVSVQKKTEEYVESLSSTRYKPKTKIDMEKIDSPKDHELLTDSPQSPTRWKVENSYSVSKPTAKKAASPIMSPTQNLSITQDIEKRLNLSDSEHNKTFTKILLPSPTKQHIEKDKQQDQGSIISVTSSGAFKSKSNKRQTLNLTKSAVQVEAYIDNKAQTNTDVIHYEGVKATPKLTANIINVQSIEVKSMLDTECVCANLVLGKLSDASPKCTSPISTLPPMVGGKTSPTKIPSPIHTLSHPRSRNSISSLSDHNLDTDLILQPTQNYINSLQQRLLVDSDPDSDYDVKYGLQLNNTKHLLKQKTSHIRHNSLDDRTMNISNKLEHFQNKNFIHSGIDQTYTNLFNQYSQSKVMHKIQNSPNNSPIRRSSSFSTKNQFDSPKNTNIQKVSNMTYTPTVQRSASVQRSSSTACIKANYRTNQPGTITDHKKIDRNQFGDTESSSEEDYDKNIQKKKDLSNTSSTRSNRAFSLRRAHADNELNCLNTPKMKRKVFQPESKQERAISVDRKPMKTNEVQSRYMLNISKRSTPPPQVKTEVKSNITKAPSRPQSFTRTEATRFSMRTSKPTTTASSGPIKTSKKEGKKTCSGTGGGGGGGPRSNSSLSSREVEFQNWKRRKSYDPMKAAAEGKRREAAARKTAHQDGKNGLPERDSPSQESSPSHSGSVHRSQSFHGTGALEQLISSDEEEDLTLSADEGFSPPTPSPCELSPARASLRNALWERIRH